MDLSKIPAMNMLQNKMKYDSTRQKVLSENIANVDTPGYTRKDIKKPSFKGMVKTNMLKLETTDSMHISGTDESSAFTPYTTKDKVELDMEALELTKNSTDFEQSSITYKKLLNLMKLAVGNK